MPPEFSGNASYETFENVTDLTTGQPVANTKSNGDDNSIVIFWIIIVAIGAVMVLSISVFGIIYTYYACEKRATREKEDKRTYRKVSSLTPDSLVNSTGGPAPSNTVTSGSNNSTLRPAYKPYELPFKPAYVATSLILREGKHMASAESDPELGESAQPATSAPNARNMNERRIALILQQRKGMSNGSPTLTRLPSPCPQRRKL